MFGVTVDYLVNAHADPVPVPAVPHYKKHNRIIIALLSVALIFLVATLLYVTFGLLKIFPLISSG
jgi:uncharacterized membrane protein YqhA